MNRLLQLKHQGLQRIARTIFNTLHAFSADLYRPESDYEGTLVAADEREFSNRDEDVVGSLIQEERPLSHYFAGATKIAPCRTDAQGKFSLVRGRDANEFDPDKTFRFLIKEPDVPKQSVLMFSRPVGLGEDDKTRLVSLIKVDESPVGQLPIAGVIHVFSYFHGELQS